MKKKIILLIAFISNILYGQCSFSLPSSEYCPFDEKYGFGFSFDFLILQPREQGLEYAFTNQSPDRMINGYVADLDFDWKCGGRAVLHQKLDYDNWTVLLGSRFIFSDTKNSEREAVTNQTSFNQPFLGNGIIPVWMHPDAFAQSGKNIRFSEAKARWHFNFYNIELMIQKKFCVGKQLSLAPTWGLQDNFIYQKYKVTYDNGKSFYISRSAEMFPTQNSVTLKQDTYSIGPRIGINADWKFCYNTCLFFNTHANLLFSYFNTSRFDTEKYTIQAANTENDFENHYKIKNKFSSIKPAADIAIGISYNRCFSAPEHIPLELNFSISYSAMIYWKNNQFIRFADDYADGINYTAKGDLQLHGFALSVNTLF